MRYAGTLLFASCFAGIAHAQPAPSLATTVATINGETITLGELDGALNANLPAISLTATQRRQLRASLLNDLIDERLLRQYLAKNAPKVDPTELESQLKAFTAQLAKENQTLADHLKRTGQSEAQLRADWTASIQLTNLVQQQATDSQLRAYHAANRDFFDKVEVRVSHLIIRVTRVGLPGEIASAREKVQSIRADLVAGKLSFAVAARKYSQEMSGLKGGDLGFIQRRGLELEEPLVKAAFAMKPGELSEVIETPTGIHLITVTERKPGKPTTVEKCVVEVLEAFTEDYRKDLIARLHKEGNIRITLP